MYKRQVPRTAECSGTGLPVIEPHLTGPECRLHMKADGMLLSLIHIFAPLMKLLKSFHPEGEHLIQAAGGQVAVCPAPECRLQVIKLHTPLHMADQQTGTPAVSIHSQKGPQLDAHILLPHPIQAADSDTFEEQIEVKVITCLLYTSPALSAYLSHNLDVFQSDIGAYMSRYKAHKLENTLPNDEDLFFSGVDTSSFDYRYAVLSEYENDETIILWVDALGIEWLSLLHWCISNHCDGTITNVVIAQATLPTETLFNKQWNNMSMPYKKLNKLDKLAHKGVIDEPDYYACIEEQMDFIEEISNYVSSLLTEYHRVVITGDHGTSRLAARFFH